MTGLLADTSTTLQSLVPTLTWDDVLSPHVYIFYAAFLVSFFFTPVMRYIAIHYGIVDQPDNARKMHKAPVAYLGGVAVFIGWVAGLAMSQLHIPEAEIGLTHLQVKMNIVVGAALIVVVGLADDVLKLRPRNKILFQMIAGIILLQGGVGSHCLDSFVAPINVRMHNAIGYEIPQGVTDVVSWLFVIGMVVGCCNATNLMDGLDGLCGGVTGVIAAGFLFLAVHLSMLNIEPEWDAVRIVLALALLGAVLGFVPYNFNPASIFMGDTGSMFLGYSCATIIILLAQEQSKWLLAGLVMFALPIMDSSLAIIRRLVNKRPIFSADRHHFHHQLLDRGFSVRKTVVISYGLTFAFCLLGMFIAYMRTRYAVAFYLVIFGSMIVAAYKMGLVHEKPRIVMNKPLGPADAVIPPTSFSQQTDVMEILPPPKIDDEQKSEDDQKGAA